MNLKKTSGLILLSFVFGFTQCSDDDDLESETKGVAIKSAEAVSCTDLSDRTDWMLLFGGSWDNEDGILYDFRTEGYKITTDSPLDKFYTFSEDYNEGDILGADNYTYIRFAPKTYYSNINTLKSKAAESPCPVIHDQSSYDKLMKADILFTRYSGTVTEHLTDIDLIHGNVLLDFETIDLPLGAEIKIQGGGADLITPYQENETYYKAITLSFLSKQTSNEIILITGDEQVSVKTNFILADTHYRFTLRFDTDKKKLIVENVIQTRWSEEKNPFDNSGLDLIGITNIVGGTLHGNGKEGIDKSNIIITNTADWQNLMTRMNSVNDITERFKETEIDFERYMVIAVFLEVKTSGWRVEIDKIKEYDNYLTISTKEQIYETTEITQPFHIIKVPKTNKEIIFE